MTPPEPVDQILFFDSSCLLCHRSVRWVAKCDPEGKVHFAPLGGETARAILPSQLRESKGGSASSVILASRQSGGEWITAEQSEAVLRVLRVGGGAPVLRSLLGITPRVLRDFGYSLIAKSRYAVFGKAEQCDLPAEDLRNRLLP